MESEQLRISLLNSILKLLLREGLHGAHVMEGGCEVWNLMLCAQFHGVMTTEVMLSYVLLGSHCGPCANRFRLTILSMVPMSVSISLPQPRPPRCHRSNFL